jgi:competence protein ComEC
VALGLFVFAGLWLCLWQGRWRFLGLPFAVIASWLWWTAVPPDILINRDGTLIGVRGDNGELGLSNTRKDKFSAKTWITQYRQTEPVYWQDALLWNDAPHFACDAGGCILTRDGKQLGFLKNVAAAGEDCGQVDTIITPVRMRCNQSMVIDKDYFRQSGALAIWLEKGVMRIEEANPMRGQRPWVTDSSVRLERFVEVKDKTDDGDDEDKPTEEKTSDAGGESGY